MLFLKVDSLQVADSLNAVQSEIAQVVAKITNTPAKDLISDFIEDVVRFGFKLLIAFLVYIVGIWLIKKVKNIVSRVFEKRQTEAAIASFVQSIISIALTILLVIITVGTLGIDTTSIAALLTGGGLAIGMALNGTVQNFAGGIMLLIFKPFKAGDLIEAQGYSGIVSEVNITSTKLTTVDNRVIIIPNGILSNGTVNNFSAQNVRRIDINVGVEYGSSSEQTKKLLLEIAKSDARTLYKSTGAPDDPFVALTALNDSSVDFVLRVWGKSENYWALRFSLMEKIYNVLPENGIMFPFPQMDVNIKTNN